MPERIRVVNDRPATAVEGDLVIGSHRHLAAVAPAGARTVALEDEVATRA